MTNYTSDVAFSPAVKDIQSRLGSRSELADMERNHGWETTITPGLTDFLLRLDMFYFGTASADGQPHIQYRGGPPGFLKVINDHTLGFADFSGNGQYMTIGDISENPQSIIFLMDYEQQKRVKIWGTARIVFNDPELFSKLSNPDYEAVTERAILLSIKAWDMNCQHHIHRRLRIENLEAILQKQQMSRL